MVRPNAASRLAKSVSVFLGHSRHWNERSRLCHAECRFEFLIGFSARTLTAFLDCFQGRFECFLQDLVVE